MDLKHDVDSLKIDRKTISLLLYMYSATAEADAQIDYITWIIAMEMKQGEMN